MLIFYCQSASRDYRAICFKEQLIRFPAYQSDISVRRLIRSSKRDYRFFHEKENKKLVLGIVVDGVMNFSSDYQIRLARVRVCGILIRNSESSRCGFIEIPLLLRERCGFYQTFVEQTYNYK